MDPYRRYGPALLRKCERMLGNRADAEDVVQSLFIDLLRRDKRDVDLPYLYRAATTRSLNAIRDRKRRQDLLDRHGDALSPPRVRVDEQLISAQLLASLVDRLDAVSAEILVYHFQDNMTQDEISDVIGLSRKTVGKKLQALRETLQTLDGGPP